MVDCLTGWGTWQDQTKLTQSIRSIQSMKVTSVKNVTIVTIDWYWFLIRAAPKDVTYISVSRIFLEFKIDFCQGSFKILLQCFLAYAKIDIGLKMLAKLERNKDFSIFMKFIWYFHRISHINNKVGFQSKFFFCYLQKCCFMYIFDHNAQFNKAPFLMTQRTKIEVNQSWSILLTSWSI